MMNSLPPVLRELLGMLGRVGVRAGIHAVDSVLNDGEAVAVEVDRRIKKARKKIKEC
jgi:hypothetical protein